MNRKMKARVVAQSYRRSRNHKPYDDRKKLNTQPQISLTSTNVAIVACKPCPKGTTASSTRNHRYEGLVSAITCARNCKYCEGWRCWLLYQERGVCWSLSQATTTALKLLPCNNTGLHRVCWGRHRRRQWFRHNQISNHSWLGFEAIANNSISY